MKGALGPGAVSDPIRLEVFNQRLLAITEEMGAHLVRCSFSPNIKERRDCSVALFDSAGRVLAQAAHIPIHLGSLVGGVEAVLRRYPPETMAPGDAFVCNDAYLAGGTHLPDIAVITPVFWADEVRYFVGCVGHHADVGGAVPGSISPDAGSIFEEGIRIPPTRLSRGGDVDENVLELIAHNTREPEERMLDLRVQAAVNERGVRNVYALVERMGLAAVEAAVRDLVTYTARRLERRIEVIPDGRYVGRAYMDNDGAHSERVPIVVTATVEGARLSFDCAGTGPQSRGAYNVMPSGVLATIAYAVKALVDPELPPNRALFEAIDVEVPLGTILNPRFPAAVGARTTTCQKLAGAIFAAFEPLLEPGSAMAPSHDVLAAMVFSGAAPRRDGAYVYLETVGGGIGASGRQDGADGAHVHITNSLNMPVEAVELEYPLLVEEYALLADSGGAGEFRGGLGIAREVRILEPSTTFSARADGFEAVAPGARGGGSGSRCQVVHNRGRPGERCMEPKQRLLRVDPGDTIRMETPGGAGFGDPALRAPGTLADDLADGKATEAGARQAFGDALVDAALALSTTGGG